MAAFTIAQVMKRIESLESMSELRVEEFAEEGELADSSAQGFGDKLKPTQLRKVFHTLKSLQREVERDKEFDRSKVIRLMPTLAYASGRGLIPEDFYKLLKLCTSREKLKTADDFTKLVEFLEAILAFHKYRSS